MARSFAGIGDPIPSTVFGTHSKPPGALGLLIRGVGVAFICRARAKVLAPAARPSACRDVPAAVAADPIPATVFGTCSKPPGALGLLIRGVGVTFICRARAKVLAAAARPSACRDVPAAVAAACARKLEAWPTCLVQTAELGDFEESSTLAWVWH
jgi:hypothetical protein